MKMMNDSKIMQGWLTSAFVSTVQDNVVRPVYQNNESLFKKVSAGSPCKTMVCHCRNADVPSSPSDNSCCDLPSHIT